MAAQSPGLVYRLDEPPVVVLLFGSGKLVITGSTQPADAEHALDTNSSRLEELGLLVVETWDSVATACSQSPETIRL